LIVDFEAPGAVKFLAHRIAKRVPATYGTMWVARHFNLISKVQPGRSVKSTSLSAMNMADKVWTHKMRPGRLTEDESMTFQHEISPKKSAVRQNASPTNHERDLSSERELAELQETELAP
jgi:hypothetical protein